MSVAPEGGRNRIMIYGPKNDGTYIVEFKTADGEALAISRAGITMKSETERDRWHGMKALWRFGATAVLVSSAQLAVLVNNSTPAAANIVYDWQRTCTLGCTGIATGVLTLAAGNPYGFVRSNFISFEYISSSGSFFLDNASPYLNAQGGISNPEGRFIFLEENAFGPNTLPLWQLVSYESAVLPITLSPEPGGWQFLNGSYFLSMSRSRM